MFIHRDFYPGNVLWARGRCTGIVDWPEACRGPVGCDVAHCRSDLIRLAGVGVADGFRAAYEAITREPHHPYWEIASVMERPPSQWDAGNLPRPGGGWPAASLPWEYGRPPEREVARAELGGASATRH